MMKMIDFSNCELSSRNLQYGGRALREAWNSL